ncbi:kelch repeat-containing protein [Hyalangium sp. s54d21]|uniref:Kelch repeat-containing protein n=1 Tax=Hyalangium rubrum TaxID=3103134 RepID=A0ABU5HA24_9BACT|nr:kelch repeat-containing protein [Hyalangium sp. s54d21]MDY7230343.1 kelch repeat-containing protein [Hyalangium sp. s54d21]
MSQSLSSEISRVNVTSSAPDIPSVSIDLAPSNGVWGGIIGNIPAGSDRAFLAQAFDSSGTLLFQGSASGITVTQDQTVLVAIVLQQVNPPPAFDNEAPIIDSLAAASTSVPAGGSISLWASAHDPNPGDTLSYAWSATAGSFSSLSEGFTRWTAPDSIGIHSITFVVTDSRGLSSSMILAINVTHSGEGEAELSISFNRSPSVASLGASPTQLAVGQTTSVSVSAADPDGDSLSYSWSASCAGSWSNASSSAAQFTPSVLPAGSCNNCSLTVSISDGRGGLNTGTVALCISNTPPPNHIPPVIVRTYRSSDTATPGQEITYEVVASDPEGSDLSFFWQANTGSLERVSQDSFRSRFTWTAPSCANAGDPPSITVTVMNAFRRTAYRSFTVTGLPTCVPPSGSWVPTGSMTSPRYRHAATLLPDGKVLVSGGRVPDEQWPWEHAYRTAEVYDPATGTWSPTGSMATERSDHTATLLPNGKVLVVGGSSSAPLAAELYDPATGTWSPAGSTTNRRNHHTATLLPNGKVLVAGGSFSPLTAELYDPATNTWSLTGAMPSTRESHTATLLPDGKVLVVGGWDGGNLLATAVLYDPTTGTWNSTGSMASTRDAHTATLLPDGKVLIAGGSSSTQAEVYDPATGTWSPTGSMVSARYFHTATLLPNGTVLVAGKFADYGAPEDSAEVYDPATGTWSLTSPLASSHQQHTATLLPNGTVLVAGGYKVDGNYELEKAELYIP